MSINQLLLDEVDAGAPTGNPALPGAEQLDASSLKVRLINDNPGGTAYFDDLQLFVFEP